MGGIPSGIWLSEYEYTSSSRSGTFMGQHYVRDFRNEPYLVFESVPGANASYVIIRLVIDGNTATGNWQEVTDMKGYYKGATYYGAIQFTFDNSQQRLNGQWAGFGKDGTINTGPWSLRYIGKSLPKEATSQ